MAFINHLKHHRIQTRPSKLSFILACPNPSDALLIGFVNNPQSSHLIFHY